MNAPAVLQSNGSARIARPPITQLCSSPASSAPATSPKRQRSHAMPLNIFSKLMPPDESFTALFCEQTKRIADAAQELRAMVRGEDAAEAHVATIRSIEMAADMVA